jgi:hypothetical protein
MNGTRNTNTQVGGTDSFQSGSLKRRMPAVEVARMDPTIISGPLALPQTVRLLLKNLYGVLDIQIACGLAGIDGTRVRPTNYPPSPGTLQITPLNNFPDTGPTYLRPLFQDPAAASNENHPLPQDLPFGWEFDTRADQCEIEVVINNSWGLTGLNGRLLVEVSLEYDGAWWDNKSIQYAMGQVNMDQVQSVLVGTGVD